MQPSEDNEALEDRTPPPSAATRGTLPYLLVVLLIPAGYFAIFGSGDDEEAPSFDRATGAPLATGGRELSTGEQRDGAPRKSPRKSTRKSSRNGARKRVLAVDVRGDVAAGLAANRAGLGHLTKGRHKDAEREFRKAYASLAPLLPAHVGDLATAIAGIVRSLEAQKQRKTVLAIYADAFEDLQKEFHGTHRYEADLQKALAECYMEAARYELAEPSFRQAFGIYRKALGPNALETLKAELALASFLAGLDRPGEAEGLFEEALGIEALEFPDKKAFLRGVYQKLARCYKRNGKHIKATHYFEKAIALSIELEGKKSRNTAILEGFLAMHLVRNGDSTRGVRLAKEAIAKLSSLGSRDDREHALQQYYELALGLRLRSKGKEALEILDEAMAFGKKHSPDHWLIFGLANEKGRTLTSLKDYVGAERVLLKNLQALSEESEQNRYLRPGTRRAVSELYKAWGKPEKAASYAPKQSGGD